MTDATADAAGEEDEPKKRGSKLPLIIGLVLALAGGGGGFFAAYSGLLPFGGGGPAASENGHAPADGHATVDAHGPDAGGEHGVAPVMVGDVGFVDLPPLVVSMGSISNLHHLKFKASLEVEPSAIGDVQALQPRVVDVLNNYMRALEPRDIEAPGAIMKLRSQMLRRIQLVVGEGRVRDLLVQEFVLN